MIRTKLDYDEKIQHPHIHPIIPKVNHTQKKTERRMIAEKRRNQKVKIQKKNPKEITKEEYRKVKEE